MALRREIARDGRSEDDLAFGRDCRAFTNLLINELPRGDFAFTMVRQFLVDAFNVLFLTGLAASARCRVRGDRREGRKGIHVSPATQPRLGITVGRRHRRRATTAAQRAIDELWGYTPRTVRAVRRRGASGRRRHRDRPFRVGFDMAAHRRRNVRGSHAEAAGGDVERCAAGATAYIPNISAICWPRCSFCSVPTRGSGGSDTADRCGFCVARAAARGATQCR